MRFRTTAGLARLTPLCLIALAAATPVRGQRPEQGDPTVFRAGVEVVELDVSVLDRNRVPVRGLTEADFSVFEDGKRRPVVAFTVVDLATLSPAAAHQTSAGSAEATASTTPVPYQSTEGRLVVILMDRTIPAGIPSQIARRVAAAAVREMGPNDVGAVIYTGTGQPSQDLTSNRARLLARIGAEDNASAVSPDMDLQEVMAHDRIEAELWHGDRVPRIIPDFDLSGECLCGLCVHDTITHIANVVRQFPRRTKSLLFIGTDLTMETRRPVQCTGRTRDARTRMFRAIDLAHLTVHSFDAIGLESRTITASLGVQGRDLTTPISPRNGALPIVDQVREKQMVRHGNLSTLPGRTGGRTVLNTNTPEVSVPEVFRESDAYYLLAFEPAATADGRPHDVRVRVNRRDVDVTTRRHYIRGRR